jgi:hypothetical protein
MLSMCYYLTVYSLQDGVVQEGLCFRLPELASWHFDGTAESLSELARVGGRTLIAISIT